MYVYFHSSAFDIRALKFSTPTTSLSDNPGFSTNYYTHDQAHLQ